MPCGCRIKKDIKRVSPEIIEVFREIPVANIDDCMGRMAAIDAQIVPFSKGKLLGPAFTVRVPQGDNLMFHAALDIARPGDIIVIDAGGYIDRAIFGELMATYCWRRGIGGIICDGAIRDSTMIEALSKFPIYAKSVTPNGPYKNGPGEIGFPVSIGNKIVNPGDLIVGDEDGIVIIPPEKAQEIANAAKIVMESEEKILKTIVQDGYYIRPWIEEKLKNIECEYL